MSAPSTSTRNVWLLALAQALMMSVNTLLFTAAAIIGFELAENKSLATLPLAIQYFSTMLTSVPASLIMSRYGRRSGFVLASIIGFIGAFIAIGAITTNSFLLYCLATPLFGIYTGFGNYFRFVATEVSPPQKHNSAISYVLAGGVLAAVVGPNLANYSKDVFEITFLGNFIVVLILYGLNLINFFVMDLPRPLNQAIVEQARPLRQIVAQPQYLVALFAAAIGFSMMSLLMIATPLAMKHEHLPFDEVAFVIQWHVLGMFVPSFFTGHLITRFGVERIISIGVLTMLSCIVINLFGTSLWHFWSALVLLGIGWNFMFIGGTTLLTKTYSEAEKAKAQAFNDLVVFSSVTLASLGAGALQFLLGWPVVNLSALPFLAFVLLSVLWLGLRQRSAQAL